MNISNSEAIIADCKFLDQIFGFKSELKNNTILIDMQNTSKYTDIEDLINERKKNNFRRK